MIVAGCLAGVLTVGFSAWLTLADGIDDTVFAAVGAGGVLGLVPAPVCAAKEKFWMALASLLVWPVGAVGAFRLAKPGSVWAHRFYREGRLQRSREGYTDPGAGSKP